MPLRKGKESFRDDASTALMAGLDAKNVCGTSGFNLKKGADSRDDGL
jgi:hypothetical protein